MRISDWSSDVCSSDLGAASVYEPAEFDPWLGAAAVEAQEDPEEELVLADLAPEEDFGGDAPWLQPAEMTSSSPLPDPADKSLGAMVARFEAGLTRRRQDARSEEHTSELQSLMSI